MQLQVMHVRIYNCTQTQREREREVARGREREGESTKEKERDEHGILRTRWRSNETPYQKMKAEQLQGLGVFYLEQRIWSMSPGLFGCIRV